MSFPASCGPRPSAHHSVEPNPVVPNFDIDCLFLHVPKAGNHYLPLGDFFNITYMPMGLPALAELARRNGHRIEILHLGVEWIHDPAFDLISSLEGQRIRAVGLPLYWHYQSHDVIEVARAIKRSHPETFVFLGGLTAGYFAAEILTEHPEIDAIVVGPGEGAILPLLDSVTAGDLSGLRDTWLRDDNGAILRMPSAEHRPCLDELVYGDLSVMRHPEVYAANFGFPLSYSPDLTPAENRARLAGGAGSFPLFVGRGCPWTCTFCSGNRDTLRRVNGTSRPEWRSVARAVDDVRRAMDHGYRQISMCFDPIPSRDAYAIELFREIRKARLDVDLYYECWGLPTRNFLRAFRESFPGERSGIALSPDSGNESVRLANKQPPYTNAELAESVRQLGDLDIPTDFFYTAVLPGETLAKAHDTRDQMRRMADHEHARRVMIWTVQLEPGSAQYERPETLNMTTDRHGFEDFYRVHGGDLGDTYSTLGYKIHDYFGDERDRGDIRDFEAHVQAFKCAEFCFLNQDPRVPVGPESGRAHCLTRRRELAERRGLPLPTRILEGDHRYAQAKAEERPADTQRRRWVTASPEAELRGAA